MNTVRSPAVAGSFYPNDPIVLTGALNRYLAEALIAPGGPAAEKAAGAPQHAPKVLVVPHAGYVYSAPVAASAFVRLSPARDTIRRVVLIGPSHRVPIYGIAVPTAEAFHTPLGDIPLDRAALDSLLDLPQVQILDAAHALEHSLEVQLPFLQQVLDSFTLVPLVAGDASAQDIATVLERLWGGDETLIVISSDLSHYYDYDTARRLDRATAAAIEHLDAEGLGEESACGRIPLRGLLTLARAKGLRARTLDLRNSGDTAGPRDKVVGYGAWAFFD